MPDTKEWDSYSLFEEENGDYMSDRDDIDFPMIRTTITHRQLLSKVLKDTEKEEDQD